MADAEQCPACGADHNPEFRFCECLFDGKAMTTMSSADIIEHLRAHPKQAVEVFEAVTVVGDWKVGECDVERVFVPEDFWAVQAWKGDEVWYWQIHNCTDIYKAPTREEAMDAADAALDVEWIVVNRRKGGGGGGDHE